MRRQTGKNVFTFCTYFPRLIIQVPVNIHFPKAYTHTYTHTHKISSLLIAIEMFHLLVAN